LIPSFTYDRMSDDVRTLTGQGPLSVQDFARKNAATFTASAKRPECLPMPAEFAKKIAEPVVTYAVA
jgi:hypothetical protein